MATDPRRRRGRHHTAGVHITEMAVPAELHVAGAIAVLAVVIAVAGAIGFGLLVARFQTRRMAELAEALALRTDGGARLRLERIRDRRLRAAFELLSGRLAATWTLATTDPLTGISNRQALFMRLDEELARSGRYGRDLSIVLLDFDNFKRLNDTYGHAGGDQVLHDVAQLIRDHVRSVDIVGRYGGEELMIVLPETDADAAASIAEKLRRQVASHRIELADGHAVSITMSAGVAGGRGALSLDALVRDADGALYSAKALGRDQVYVFREPDEADLVRSATIRPEARYRALQVGLNALGAATDTLTDALEARTPWAGKPSELVAVAATTVARSVGLSEGEIERIRVASLLHDLGKLAIPDEILSSPGELGTPEWRVVAEHPKIGQIVLEQAGALRDAATIVLHHHEWFDGRGYPHGLSGEEIPIGSRIVAIADAYEAMVAGRPYRGAISHEAALVELRRQAGVQFDPDLVEQFVALFVDGVPIPRVPSTEDGPAAMSAGPFEQAVAAAAPSSVRREAWSPIGRPGRSRPAAGSTTPGTGPLVPLNRPTGTEG